MRLRGQLAIGGTLTLAEFTEEPALATLRSRRQAALANLEQDGDQLLGLCLDEGVRGDGRLQDVDALGLRLRVHRGLELPSPPLCGQIELLAEGGGALVE